MTQRVVTLLENKLSAFQYGVPDVIATANIGCQLHLDSGTGLPSEALD